jgi:hypothetical protein
MNLNAGIFLLRSLNWIYQSSQIPSWRRIF